MTYDSSKVLSRIVTRIFTKFVFQLGIKLHWLYARIVILRKWLNALFMHWQQTYRRFQKVLNSPEIVWLFTGIELLKAPKVLFLKSILNEIKSGKFYSFIADEATACTTNIFHYVNVNVGYCKCKLWGIYMGQHRIPPPPLLFKAFSCITKKNGLINFFFISYQIGSYWISCW